MIRKYPKNVYFNSHKAWTLCRLGRFDEAIIYFDEVVAQNQIDQNQNSCYLEHLRS